MFRFAVAVGAVALALSACSKSTPHVERVAARVNGEAISVPEFQMVMNRAAQAAQKPEPAALMDGLIDRKLFARKAAALKYDQEPAVALLLEEAKEQILAQAYVTKLAGWSSADDAAVTAFYDENHDLFEQRHVYQVIELAVVASPDQLADLKRRAARAHDLYKITAWLKALGLRYNLAAVAKGSEQLAPQLLSRLKRMHEGEITVMDSAGGASVLQLLQSDPAPLGREAAAPMIENMLAARKRAEVAERELKYLRSKAAIEYVVDLHANSKPQP
jgi:EpsD family peptidyl-prolyl cis-trans isomerase